MAVKLRLRRMGRKKRPFYRIVAADSRAPRDGRFIESIGYYNPLHDPIELEIKEDRALYWLEQGAIPTDTVKSLLRRKGITLQFDLKKRGLPQEKIEEEMKKWEVLQLERERRLAQEREAQKPKKEEAPVTAEAPAPAEAEAETAPEPAAEEPAQATTEAADTSQEPEAAAEASPETTAEEESPAEPSRESEAREDKTSSE
ncbi:MAG: 30S ribosomal protein S16 [Calditrichaeota bacterium]|nr:MAG: 30S ribosomal protein S16 [Calditrichota bacterium]